MVHLWAHLLVLVVVAQEKVALQIRAVVAVEIREVVELADLASLSLVIKKILRKK
jgi:hypothetical protein